MPRRYYRIGEEVELRRADSPSTDPVVILDYDDGPSNSTTSAYYVEHENASCEWVPSDRIVAPSR